MTWLSTAPGSAKEGLSYCRSYKLAKNCPAWLVMPADKNRAAKRKGATGRLLLQHTTSAMI